MKRSLPILLALLLLTGCGPAVVPVDPPFEGEFPALTLVYEGGETAAEQGLYSWAFMRADGLTAEIHADGNSKLYNWERTALLPGAASAELCFDWPPETVTVIRWEKQYWGGGDYQAGVPVETVRTDAGWQIDLADGAWLYEVIAEWTDRTQEYGRIAYGFRTE